MEVSKSSWYSNSTGGYVRYSTTSTAPYMNSTTTLTKSNIASSDRTQSAHRLQFNSTTTTTPPATSSTLYTFSTINIFTSPSFSHRSASATPTVPASATSTQKPSLLSPQAAMGIGVAAGVIGILLLITIGVIVYRCWKARRSPQTRYYRQTRLWKGFTPATPSSATTPFVDSKMATTYFTELESPMTPGFVLSPPLGEYEPNWPLTPPARSYAVELPG